MLSGGLDSATCLYWARERFSVSAITFNYFGRLHQEKRATHRLAEVAGIKVIEIEMPFVKEASDFYSNGRMKEKEGSDLRWASYVPARNMMFYSVAAYYAEYLNAKWIVGGHNRHDMSFFKDASKSYIEKMNSLFAESCLMCDDTPYQIILPLSEMDRKAIISLAHMLRVPIELTWSCHQEGDHPCQKCYACMQRIEAFSALGIIDPVFGKKK